MLIQSAFFAAYFLISIPAAAVVTRVGYMRAAMIGLMTMTAGCLLLVPASSSGLFVNLLGTLLRPGGRHHHRSGGDQSADFHAR